MHLMHVPYTLYTNTLLYLPPPSPPSSSPSSLLSPPVQPLACLTPYNAVDKGAVKKGEAPRTGTVAEFKVRGRGREWERRTWKGL